MPRPGRFPLLIASLGLFASTARADDVGLSHFEQKIRPVLVKECYGCHASGAKSIKGGLLLDTKEGLLKGGDSGPALVPGKPGESLLIDALKYEGVSMPPRGKLPASVVADFERWIALGAADPRTGSAEKRTGIDIEAGRRFWAYRDPIDAPAPSVSDPAWPRGEIDRFLLAAMEAKGVRPNRDADRVTLIRRLSYDLTGLPPTPDEIDAFLADRSADAYERLVGRLLASPRFGERWGRHWLDVVRYADSLTLRGFVLPDAWRYRDYVIESFQKDVPFDRFVREQVAGDLMTSQSLEEKRRQLVATTFLALGNSNLEEQDKAQLRMDVVDEQIDTIGKAFLGQTIGCARCHDHKFDPIPTKDYYAIAGVFRNARAMEHANVSRWIEVDLPLPPDREAAVAKAEKAIAGLEARIKSERARLASSGKASAAPGPLAADAIPGIVVDDVQARLVGEWKPSQHAKTYIGSGYIHDLDSDKGTKTVTFQPDLKASGRYDVWLAYSPGGNRSKSVPVTIMSADGEKSVNVDMVAPPPIDGRFISLGQYRFEKNGQGFVIVSNEGTKGHVTPDAVIFRPAGAGVSDGEKPKARVETEAKVLRSLEAELKALKATAPRREKVISVVEESKIEDARIHIRGTVHNLGETAPRGVLGVASRRMPAFPSTQSGRVQFAGWLASPENPLTARVYVNRVWHWLMGDGLVRTTDNFGSTGEAPSHRELLDHLAVRFMRDGWSTKSLIRSIVTSRAYQLASDDRPDARSIDPENRLRWRMNRRRLDAECIRDALLAASGELDLKAGGPDFPADLAADYGYQHTSKRRSVYLPVFRNALPPIYEVFDFADPSMVVGRRDVSTVAPQALFLLNNPFVIDQARAIAKRAGSGANSDDERISQAYRLILGRAPTGRERDVAARFLADSQGDDPDLALLCQALIGSLDFRYID